MPFGYHLMLDMYQCTGSAISSIESCYRFLEELCDRLGMEKQSPPFLFRSDEVRFPDKAGLSGWLPLIESGIQIHTIEQEGFVSLDVYSCRFFEPDMVVQFARDYFTASDVEQEFILRGKKFSRRMQSGLQEKTQVQS